MNTVNKIITELEILQLSLDESQFKNMVHTILCANRIFVCGAGRSGCVAQAFSNRLLHLGLCVYYVGNITTPPIKKGDLLFLISGSGKTSTLVQMVKKAKEQDAIIATMTLQPQAIIGSQSDSIITLPGTTRLQDDQTISSIQPTGTSFEQLSWLSCDALVMLLKEQTHQTNEDLITRHANLE